MKKKIIISQTLKSFTGEDILEEGVAMTFKNAILVYLNNAHNMGFSMAEESKSFEVAMLIGGAQDSVILDQQQYDFLKKICDKGGKIKVPQAGEQPLFAIVISQQLKKIVDDAVSIDETKNPGGAGSPSNQGTPGIAS